MPKHPNQTHPLSLLVPLSLCLLTPLLPLRAQPAGTVLEQGSNTPLQNAIISLNSTWEMTLSNAQGKFGFGEASSVLPKIKNQIGNPVTIKGNSAVIRVTENTVPVKASLFTADGRRVAELFDQVCHPGDYNVNLVSKNMGNALYFARFSVGREIYTYSLVSHSTSGVLVSASGKVPQKTTMAKKAHSFAESDTLVISKYGYEPVYLPINSDNTDLTIRLTKMTGQITPPGMKKIPGDIFIMGSERINTEAPIHAVTVSSFFMDSTEVTQADYELLLGATPWNSYPDNHGYPGDVGYRQPAWYLTWNDAILYCNARSKRDGLDTVYTYSSYTGIFGDSCILQDVEIDYTKRGYRLPTEAEWEFAARAHCGTADKYFWGDDVGVIADEYAWWSGNSSETTYPVAMKKPNSFKLYDILGNVLELVNDYMVGYQQGSFHNPIGPENGEERVFRGGSYLVPISEITVTRRHGIEPDNRKYVVDLGLRPVLPCFEDQ